MKFYDVEDSDTKRTPLLTSESSNRVSTRVTSNDGEGVKYKFRVSKGLNSKSFKSLRKFGKQSIQGVKVFKMNKLIESIKTN